jgi:hypothetical protein
MQESAENIELSSECATLPASTESRARRRDVTLSPADSDLLYTLPAIAAHCGMTEGQAKPLVAAVIIPVFKLPGRQTLCASKASLREAWARYERSWRDKHQRALATSRSR